MELGRRRLWLALASASAFLLQRLIVELALGQGYEARHLVDQQPFARVVIAFVALAMTAVIVRDLRRARQDWPVERLVAVAATVMLITDIYGLLVHGPSVGFDAAGLAAWAGWLAGLAGAAIWLPGKRP